MAIFKQIEDVAVAAVVRHMAQLWNIHGTSSEYNCNLVEILPKRLKTITDKISVQTNHQMFRRSCTS